MNRREREKIEKRIEDSKRNRVLWELRISVDHFIIPMNENARDDF